MRKNRPIQIMAALGAITLLGVIAVQVYWVSVSVSAEEETFDHNVRMALRRVADRMCLVDGNELIANKPIDRISRNYFVARLRYNIDVSALESLINQEFEQRDILQEYEYGVYNCESDRMVFGNRVNVTDGVHTPSLDLPRLEQDEYYFGVYFPNKSVNLLMDMTSWKYFTAISGLMLVFFTYGFVVVLKQRRLSEIQKDFMDNVTHELKTPLATLKLSSEAMLQTTEPEKQKRYANIIQEETSKLEKQIEQIVQASLVEEDVTIAQEKGSFSEIFEQELARFKTIYPDIQWQVETPIESGAVYLKNSLRIVLGNLMDNAAKYGRGIVRIKFAKEQKKLIVEIIDNGAGIPQQHLTRIFDKFYRMPTDNVHNVKGFGLGMYLVKQHLKLLNGRIAVTSSENGTNCRIQLPDA